MPQTVLRPRIDLTAIQFGNELPISESLPIKIVDPIWRLRQDAVTSKDAGKECQLPMSNQMRVLALCDSPALLSGLAPIGFSRAARNLFTDDLFANIDIPLSKNNQEES